MEAYENIYTVFSKKLTQFDSWNQRVSKSTNKIARRKFNIDFTVSPTVKRNDLYVENRNNRLNPCVLTILILRTTN